MKFLRVFLADVATLRRPVTATAVVGLIVATVEPFGLAPSAAALAAALVAVGTVAAYVERMLNR